VQSAKGLISSYKDALASIAPAVGRTTDGCASRMHGVALLCGKHASLVKAQLMGAMFAACADVMLPITQSMCCYLVA
jgi:hypothetical protein